MLIAITYVELIIFLHWENNQQISSRAGITFQFSYVGM